MTSGYPAIGDRIGRFRVVAQLGAGGMGVVYSALEETLDRLVALKVISPMYAEDAGFRERFASEARSLASLDSPHVVQVYAHGEEDGHLYIATQLIPDGDLGQMIGTWGPAPLGQALELIEQVAAGLSDAHAAGLVHRDIKPANVLVRRRGNTVSAYLGDFGIARRLDAEVTRLGAGVVGTPAYMAPELHSGTSAGVTSDVYSVGCLLWVALTGVPPFAGSSEYEIVGAHHTQPVPQIVGAGPMVESANLILRTAMAKDPAQRYASAADLRDALRDGAALGVDRAEAPVVVRPVAPPVPTPAFRPPPPTAVPTWPSPARRRRPVALAAVAGAAVVAIGGGAAAALLVGDGAQSVADPGPGPTMTTATSSSSDPAFVEWAAEEILTEAEREMKVLDSVRLDGTIVLDGQSLDLDLTVTTAGDCDGSMVVADGRADLRSIGGQTWFRPDRGFWVAVGGDEGAAAVDAIVAAQDGRWVETDEEEFEQLCDLDELLEGDSSSANSAAVKGEQGTVDGRPVIGIETPEDGDTLIAYVGLDEPHYVLRLESGSQGRFDFSDFDEPFVAEPPAAEEITDLASMGN